MRASGASLESAAGGVGSAVESVRAPRMRIASTHSSSCWLKLRLAITFTCAAETHSEVLQAAELKLLDGA